MKQAKDLIQAKGICKKGGLLLDKFISNDRQVLELVPRSERAIDVVLDRPSKELSIERVGVQWVNGSMVVSQPLLGLTPTD